MATQYPAETKAKVEPEVKPKPEHRSLDPKTFLFEARDKYRAGLITMGELFAAWDHFLDGVPKDAPLPEAKENK